MSASILSHWVILLVGAVGLLFLRNSGAAWPLLVIVGVFLYLAAALAWWYQHGKYD